MGVTLILTIIGFFLALAAGGESGLTWSRPHKIIGVIIFTLVIFQPLNAIIRPHKEENVERQPLLRFIWELVHKNSGRAIAGLSIFNVFTGLIMLGESHAIISLQVAYIVIVAVVFIGLETYWKLGPKFLDDKKVPDEAEAELQSR